MTDLQLALIVLAVPGAFLADVLIRRGMRAMLSETGRPPEQEQAPTPVPAHGRDEFEAAKAA